MHAISSYRGNTPTHTHIYIYTHTPTHKQTGPITIHCAAASAQCNYTTIHITCQCDHNVCETEMSRVFFFFKKKRFDSICCLQVRRQTIPDSRRCAWRLIFRVGACNEKVIGVYDHNIHVHCYMPTDGNLGDGALNSIFDVAAHRPWPIPSRDNETRAETKARTFVY